MTHTEYALEQIQNLLKIPSPTGFTKGATDYLIEELTAMGYEPVRTLKGAVICHLSDGDHPMLLSAHVERLVLWCAQSKATVPFATRTSAAIRMPRSKRKIVSCIHATDAPTPAPCRRPLHPSTYSPAPAIKKDPKRPWRSFWMSW